MTDPNFGQLLIAQVPYLRAFAISLSGSYADADDLVQETLVKAWAHADDFQADTNLRAWLVTILRNTYFTLYKKRSREVADVDEKFSGQIAVKGGQESRVQVDEMRKALAKLPPEQREVLLMIGVAELSYEETAQICNVAIGTVKSRLNRARAKLAELLGLTQTNEIGSEPL